jgi:DNA-binding NtrC family response regulator
MNSRILIVEDDSEWSEYLSEVLRDEYDTEIAIDGKSSLATLEEKTFNCLILDLGLPDFKDRKELALLKALLDRYPEIPIIIFTAERDTSLAVKAARMGAFDYLTKAPLDTDKLLNTVRNAIEQNRLKKRFRERINIELSNYPLIGKSQAIRKIKELINKFAGVEDPVIVTGRTGTGKEIVARHLHFRSKRVFERFLVPNIKGLDGNLAHSELFGHKRGSFSGAIRDRDGLFRAANGGTLFLDDIDNLNLDVQAMLLRVIEDGIITPLGGEQEIAVDVRLITSTNKDLEGLISKGEFREDLYYRLSGIEIRLPPLKDRLEDVPVLLDYFIDKYTGEGTKRRVVFSREALDTILEYDWGGNIRELEKMIKRIVIDPDVVEVKDSDVAELLGLPITGRHEPGSLKEATSLFQKKYIEKILVKNDCNISHSADELKMARQHLQRLIKALDIKVSKDK